MQSPILLTGASGLIGGAVTNLLDRESRSWRSVSHRDSGWDPAHGTMADHVLGDADTVIHLAGESIAGLRWTNAKKQRIYDSRVYGTRAVAEAMARRDKPPSTLVCASAVGYYGDRGDEELTEDAEPGSGFLADVVRDWEAAADPAREAGVRVVHLRLGVVLSPKGGALGQMLPAFRLGLGGRLSTGDMWMSWVHLRDVARAFVRAGEDDAWTGVYNVTAPTPVTNRTFTHALGRVLHRPTALPVPAFAIKLGLGEMGDALLLSSTRAVPERLSKAGFTFEYSHVEPALKDLL